jgi:hypothetical protein
MSNFIKYLTTVLLLIAFIALVAFIGCGKKDDPSNKNNLQYIADKEKELSDREAKIRLKEAELEEREKKLNLIENGKNIPDTSTSQKTDTSKSTDKNKKDKKEIQQELSKKFENPATTVKDYYEYIQRAINETGNFDANMKKAHEYFPSRSPDKMKASYRNTKMFTVIEEPKVVSQKDNNATVSSNVKQVDAVKKDSTSSDVSKTMTVTYYLQANKDGQWVITGNSVKAEQ